MLLRKSVVSESFCRVAGLHFFLW